MTPSPGAAQAKTQSSNGWGSKSGNEKDKIEFKDIIAAELKKPENRGDFASSSFLQGIIIHWQRFGGGPSGCYQYGILQFLQDVERRQSP